MWNIKKCLSRRWRTHCGREGWGGPHFSGVQGWGQVLLCIRICIKIYIYKSIFVLISILVIISYWHFSGIDGRLKVCIDLQPKRLEINMFILSFTGNTTTGNPDDEHPGWSELVFHSPSYRSSMMMMMMSSSLWWRYVSISYFQKQAGYHLQWSSPITSLPRRTGCPPCTEQREEIHRILEASMEWTCGKHWLGTGTYINIASQ